MRACQEVFWQVGPSGDHIAALELWPPNAAYTSASCQKVGRLDLHDQPSPPARLPLGLHNRKRHKSRPDPASPAGAKMAIINDAVRLPPTSPRHHPPMASQPRTLALSAQIISGPIDLLGGGLRQPCRPGS